MMAFIHSRMAPLLPYTSKWLKVLRTLSHIRAYLRWCLNQFSDHVSSHNVLVTYVFKLWYLQFSLQDSSSSIFNASTLLLQNPLTLLIKLACSFESQCLGIFAIRNLSFSNNSYTLIHSQLKLTLIKINNFSSLYPVVCSSRTRPFWVSTSASRQKLNIRPDDKCWLNSLSTEQRCKIIMYQVVILTKVVHRVPPTEHSSYAFFFCASPQKTHTSHNITEQHVADTAICENQLVHMTRLPNIR